MKLTRDDLRVLDGKFFCQHCMRQADRKPSDTELAEMGLVPRKLVEDYRQMWRESEAELADMGLVQAPRLSKGPTEMIGRGWAERNGYVQVWVNCPTCEGTGIDPLSDAQPSGMDLHGHLLYDDEDCPDCNGSGKVLAEGVIEVEAIRYPGGGVEVFTNPKRVLILPDPTQETT